MGDVTPFPAVVITPEPNACRVTCDFDRWYLDLVEDVGGGIRPRLFRRIPYMCEGDARRVMARMVSENGLKPLADQLPPPTVYFEGGECA